jgi:type II secretory ATPase GspE/PulE/Tfp pilus assembly ATPase PilB-like protein
MDPPAIVPFDPEDADTNAYADLRPACIEHGFLPTFRHGILLDAAMVAPQDPAALSAIRRLTHQEVRRFQISEEDFDRAVAALETHRVPYVGSGAAETGTACGEPVLWPETWDFYQRSPRDVAAEMVRCSFAAGASDLLLDDQEDRLDVAVKLGGQKEILPPVEKAAAVGLLKAFKEMAGLPAQAVGTWQSGSFRLPAGNGRRADLRIEITPTVHGESLVARIQDAARQIGRMGHLPFDDSGQARLASGCLAQRQGLIVVTGPTGHGKTTTLYACLGQLDSSLLNLRTLEDPVEFAVPWITQIPVGAGTGRGYADGLKSLLRQAPDVILLGEIRDRVAAQVCVEAVDTGHLILATLHTRDAIGVAARLLDLGVTGRQIASSLLLAIGQRLLRRLCPSCRRRAPATAREARHFERYGLPVPEALHRPGRCARCGGRGERGVTAVFELFHPGGHEDLAEMIGHSDLRTFDERALRARWLAVGGSTLVREGLLKVAAGEVAHAEVLKYERNPPD